ncbi:MAG: pyridoxal-phosphate dependent enzyme, partial [Myxococcota bacterium]|nr:pyridoxal-phosphate dependent enzyme [Myxococcota bacterium]
RTPVLTCRTLDAMAGRQLFFKCENLQRMGAFKFRGALNAVALLPGELAARGVVTHSSGNFAQALALAAKERGIPAHIVMPSSAPAVKQRAVAGYGGLITLCEPTLDARTQTAARIEAETGATLLHPYDHPDVIAGQGTVALELLDEVPALDAIVAPLGGGGLLSGIALAARELCPSLQVIGAEPAGADDAARSRAAGRLIPQTDPQTIADGLLTSLGEHTWPVVRDVVHDVITVDDKAILESMRLIWERMKLLVEASAALPLAVVLAESFRARPELRRIGIVLSGGNVDLDALPWSS